MKAPVILLLAAATLSLPLMAQQPAAAPAPAAQLATELAESLDCLERTVLPALRSARDRDSAEAAALRIEEAAPHLRRIAHVMVDDLSLAEQQQVLPMLAPRMKQLLYQLDSCCRLSANLLCTKPAACGSERLAAALTHMLDCLMGVPAYAERGHTDPESIPLALAEADAQVAATAALLASLERLQNRDAVERELPTIQQQLNDLRALHRDLSDPQRWSKTQLFLIMQRTRERGSATVTDLGKCAARLLGMDPPCYGSAELEQLLTGLLLSANTPPAEDEATAAP